MNEKQRNENGWKAIFACGNAARDKQGLIPEDADAEIKLVRKEKEK